MKSIMKLFLNLSIIMVFAGGTELIGMGFENEAAEQWEKDAQEIIRKDKIEQQNFIIKQKLQGQIKALQIKLNTLRTDPSRALEIRKQICQLENQIAVIDKNFSAVKNCNIPQAMIK